MKQLQVLVISILASLLSYSTASAKLVEESSFKQLDHWVMGCDNWGNCKAVGFPRKAENKLHQEWYVVISWTKDNEKLDINVRSRAEEEEQSIDNIFNDDTGIKHITDIKLCDNSSSCECVQYSKKTFYDPDNSMGINGYSPPLLVYYSFQYDFNFLKKYNSFYIISDAFDDSINKLDITDFLNNFNNLRNNPSSLKTYKEYQVKSGLHFIRNNNFEYLLSDDDYKVIAPQIIQARNSINLDKDSCPSKGFFIILKYNNGDDLLFICNNDGKAVNTFKKQHDKYEATSLIDEKTRSYIDNGNSSDTLIPGLYMSKSTPLPIDWRISQLSSLHIKKTNNNTYCETDFTMGYD